MSKEEELRLECLRLAVEIVRIHTHLGVVDLAESLYSFTQKK